MRRWTRRCENCHPLISISCPPPLTTHSIIREGKPDDYLNSLSALGHFLKGSSATLGLIKVKNSCEYIQNLGLLKDETGTDDISEDDAYKKIKKYIALVKEDFEEVKKLLEKFYETTPH